MVRRARAAIIWQWQIWNPISIQAILRLAPWKYFENDLYSRQLYQSGQIHLNWGSSCRSITAITSWWGIRLVYYPKLIWIIQNPKIHKIVLSTRNTKPHFFHLPHHCSELKAQYLPTFGFVYWCRQPCQDFPFSSFFRSEYRGKGKLERN